MAAVLAVLLVVRCAHASPIWLSKTQYDTAYAQMALSGPIEGTVGQAFNQTPVPWGTAVSFAETVVGWEDRLRVRGDSWHMVAPHAGEAPEGPRWEYDLSFIGAPGPLGTVRAQTVAVLAIHPGTPNHLDIFRTSLVVQSDGAGGIASSAYYSAGRHQARPCLLYAAPLAGSSGAHAYGDATLFLDAFDSSIVMGVVIAHADFVDFTSAKILRTEDDAMVLDIRSEGNWQDAGGMGIAGDVGFTPAVTFPREFLPDLANGNTYVEIRVADDVITGALTQIEPKELIIPEPATGALAALMLAALGAYLRRRRQA